MSPLSLLLASTLLAGGAAPSGAPASTSRPPPEASTTVRDAAARLLAAAAAGEPDVVTVQRAAEIRAAPSRDEAESWRRRARLAGLLPKMTAEYRHDERSLHASGISSGEELDYIRIMPGDTMLVRLAWDLDQLVFGRAELGVAVAAQSAQSRRHVAAEQATKLWSERLRLRLLLATSPPTTAQARAEAELQLATVTAQLHALTGLYEEELR